MNFQVRVSPDGTRVAQKVPQETWPDRPPDRPWLSWHWPDGILRVDLLTEDDVASWPAATVDEGPGR